MNPHRFLEELNDRVLVGDGAVGTELFALGVPHEMGVERTNLLMPDLVTRLHRAYVAAGSRIIETNTFGANRINLSKYGAAESEVKGIILAAVRLAREAASDEVYVAGSVGPLPIVEGEQLDPDMQSTLFTEQVASLLEGGVDVLIFESFTITSELAAAVRLARGLCNIPIIAQAAYGSDGHTSDGVGSNDVARQCIEAGADVVGANCGYGVPSIMSAIRGMSNSGAPMSAYLNAGFPERVEGRLLYPAAPDYLVSRAVELVGLGVSLIGGCCGTSPATIKSIAAAVENLSPKRPAAKAARAVEVRPPEAPPPAPEPSPKFPILVELDPPQGPTLGPLVRHALAVKHAGATGITIADNPLASARADSLSVGAILQRETGLPATPHVTGRDRNRLALKSMVMAAHIQGIRSLLCVTGDPVRMCEEPNTSGVFDLTSVGLVRLVSDFNRGARSCDDCRTAFAIGVALNPNVRTIGGQIDKLKRKIDAGADFALTQPIFEESRLDVLQQALLDAGITIPAYIGILPLVSARNAEFLHNEVPGILIPEKLRGRMARYESAADQRKCGEEIALELVNAFASRVGGLYVITPRNKIELVLPLIEQAKSASRSVK